METGTQGRLTEVLLCASREGRGVGGDGGKRGGTLLPDSWVLVSVALSQTPGKSVAIAGPVMDRHTQHWLTLQLLTPAGFRRELGKREKERLKTHREKQRQT